MAVMSEIYVQYGPLNGRAFIYAPLGTYYDIELISGDTQEVSYPPFCNIHMDPGAKTLHMVDEYPYIKVREQLQSMHDKLVLARAPKYFLTLLFLENDYSEVSQLMLAWLNMICTTHRFPHMVLAHIESVAMGAVIKPMRVINKEIFDGMISELRMIAVLVMKNSNSKLNTPGLTRGVRCFFVAKTDVTEAGDRTQCPCLFIVLRRTIYLLRRSVVRHIYVLYKLTPCPLLAVADISSYSLTFSGLLLLQNSLKESHENKQCPLVSLFFLFFIMASSTD